ncbi:hypothetical protein PG999_000682 [Apiospora kogelbergensis]|uniref:Uncharacterized protein n=1 Tax=Apiospora kogelbergensis TaxID=1337665 RepID=A0AAW0RCH4_9PEZI
MVKRSTDTNEPSSSQPFDLAFDVLGQGKLPRRIFKIPEDQSKILNDSNSWAEDLFRHPRGLVNVPGEVLQNVLEFHGRKLKAPSRQEGSAISSQSKNGLHGNTTAAPSLPSGLRSSPAHEDSDSDSAAGTLISSWPSSPPAANRGPPEELAPGETAPEDSDDESFTSQLAGPSIAVMQTASSTGGPTSQREQSSLEQPFESQLHTRPPLQAGAGNSNPQKQPAFNDFPSSSPAQDEELEIVQPVAYDREMMPPPPHKAVEPNPTPPSAQQVQVVPSTFSEPQSSKSSSHLPQMKAARKHRVQPCVDVEKLLTGKLPTVKPMPTSGLRAPPKAKPHTYVLESSFSDETSSSVIPSTEHHQTLRTPSKGTNGISPPKTLIRETQVSPQSNHSNGPSQSSRPGPQTSRAVPRIAHPLSSSPRDHPLSILTQPPIALSQSPKVTPLAAALRVISPAPSGTIPIPGPSDDSSGLQPDDTVAQSVMQNDTHGEEKRNPEQTVADLGEQLKRAQLDTSYWREQSKSRSPRFIVHTAGDSKSASGTENPPRVSDDDAMVVNQVTQQVAMGEKDNAQAPFNQYVNAYPTYIGHGNLWDFVCSCTYIRVLQRKKALASYQYDDFIRAWVEGFVPHVRSSLKPQVAIDWYMETVDNTRFQFCKGIITRDNIEMVFKEYPAESKKAQEFMCLSTPESVPHSRALPLAEVALATPSKPPTGTAYVLEEVFAQPEKPAAIVADNSPRPEGDSQLQGPSKGSQSDPIDSTIADARKPKLPVDTIRRSASEMLSRKRPAGDVLVAASPKRTAPEIEAKKAEPKRAAASHDSSLRQSQHSTPSATLRPSSASGGLPRSTGPWRGPTKHANNPEKRARSYQKYLRKRLRDQESIVNSSALSGGTPTSAQKD